MLTCLTCSKQQIEDEDDEVGARGTPNNREAVKSLTAQMKDVLKVSKGKPPIAPGSRYPYHAQAGSSSSTPAWDFDPSHTSGGYEPPRQSGHLDLQDIEDEPKEWTAQVESGVDITFVSLPEGGNDLKRIRFNRDVFDKWQAQKWWGENYDRIMELYNVQKFNVQALNTSSQSEDGRDSTYSRLGDARESPMMTPSINKDWNGNYGGSNQHYNVGPSAYVAGGPKGGQMSSMEASRTTTSSRDEASNSVSNASDMESEWIVEDEPGVFITIRQLTDGTRELRRVRFSRETFGEGHAKQWWEQNRERIQTQYL